MKDKKKRLEKELDSISKIENGLREKHKEINEEIKNEIQSHNDLLKALAEQKQKFKEHKDTKSTTMPLLSPSAKKKQQKIGGVPLDLARAVLGAVFDTLDETRTGSLEVAELQRVGFKTATMVGYNDGEQLFSGSAANTVRCDVPFAC